MPIEGTPNVDPTRPAQRPSADTARPAEFQRMIERLETLAQSRDADEVPDLERLRDAMRAADDEFSAAMDLRQRLEDAYRKARG